jgi:hypothetical protein
MVDEKNEVTIRGLNFGKNTGVRSQKSAVGKDKMKGTMHVGRVLRSPLATKSNIHPPNDERRVTNDEIGRGSMMETGSSKEVARAALSLAMSSSREEEKLLKEEYRSRELRAAAVDFGGEALSCMKTIVERAVVAAKREAIIADCHAAEGAIAGAAREAMAQILTKAIGLNIGGKVGIARKGDHLSVAAFFSIGLVHLDEIAVGLSHRAIGEVVQNG